MEDGLWLPKLQTVASPEVFQEAGEVESAVIVGQPLFYIDNTIWHSLTGNATWDGIVVTICLLVTTIALNFSIERVVYGDLRSGGGSKKQQMSYLGMSRLLYMEEFTRSRKTTQKVSFNGAATARYEQRNRLRNMLARASGMFIMLMEIAVVVIALPSNRGRIINSAEWVQITLNPVEAGVHRSFALAGNYCQIGNLVHGVNVNSNARWEYCFTGTAEMAGTSPDCFSNPLDEGIYQISIETSQSRASIDVFFAELVSRSDLTARIQYEGSPAYQIPHSFTAVELDDQYYHNLSNMFLGAEVEFLERTLSPADEKGVARVQYKLKVLNFADPWDASSPVEPLQLASYLEFAFLGLFHWERSDGLDLLVFDEELDEFVNVESDLLIYSYVGSFITALGSVVMASSSLLLAAATVAIFRSVPDSSWMLKMIFGRKSGDNIGSGPEKVLHLTKSVSDEGQIGHVQYGVPNGYVEVSEFQPGLVLK